MLPWIGVPLELQRIDSTTFVLPLLAKVRLKAKKPKPWLQNELAVFLGVEVHLKVTFLDAA